MRFTPVPFSVLVLIAAQAAGCYHMYGPYGPCGYPGNYYGTPPYGSPGMGYPGMPTQTLTPGQPYYPGTVSPSTPSTFDQQNGTNSGGGDAQPFGGGADRPAPDPYFTNPNATQYQPDHSSQLEPLQPARHQQSDAAQPIAPLRQARQTPQSLPSIPQSQPPLNSSAPRALEQFDAAPVNSYSPPADPAAELQFERPLQANPFPNLEEPAPAPEQSSDPFSSDVRLNKVNPYAYDSGYRWLKGVVSRNPAQGTWAITYSAHPSPDDPLAGRVTLAPSPVLERLAEGDVIQVDGTIDPVARDPSGRPVYLVARLEKVAAP